MALQFNGWYEVRVDEDFVEVLLLIENSVGEPVVMQTEGEYKTLEDAKHFINHLESIEAEIKYIYHEGYSHYEAGRD